MAGGGRGWWLWYGDGSRGRKWWTVSVVVGVCLWFATCEYEDGVGLEINGLQ